MYAIMQQVLLRQNKIRRSKEHFWIVCLAPDSEILLIELMGLGGLQSAPIEPMDVFSFALQKRAAKLIMVHNHPSGTLAHSKTDYELTERMYAIGDFIRMPVIDHLIISETGYYSFANEGLLKAIAAEKRYDLTFANVGELLNEIKHMEERQKKELKKTKLEMAKKVLKEGLSIDKVIKISGLSKKEIEALKGKPKTKK